ncbi:DNA polymerase III subunit theta [Enterobacter kobei]|nr:DNA polymerase III subunit theta [Enterobacter kobei]
MSKWNIASFSKEEQDKVSVDKAAAAVAWQERMNKPVVQELDEREQPEHLRQYFRQRLEVHRQNIDILHALEDVDSCYVQAVA